MCRGGKRSVSASDTRIRGRNIRRLLFRRSKHRKQVRQIAQQRKSENLNWGGFPSWYSSLPPTEDLVPRSRTIRGEGGGGRRERRRSSTPPTRDSAPCRRRTSAEINFRRETTSSKIQNHQCQEEERQLKPDQRDSAFRRKS